MREPLTRTFVAVEVAARVREAVRAVQDRLRSAGADLRWVRPENLHLTLRFLGEITAGQVEEVKAATREAATGQRPFALTLEGLGAFPSAARPQVVWIGVGAGRADLERLAASLTRALAGRGFDPGERFSAHLTIGRARSRSDRELAAALAKVDEVSAGAQPVSEVVVVASRLGPGGPAYTALDRAPLRGNGT